MAIYLSQHGKSTPKDVDPERGLTTEGRAGVERVAQILAEAGVCVDVIRHSGKVRAAQSADIFAAKLKPDHGVESCAGIDSLDDVREFANALPRNRDEMYVGHLPFMERMVSFLVTGDPELRVVAFKNGGVVRLDRDEDAERWVIEWAVFPDL